MLIEFLKKCHHKPFLPYVIYLTTIAFLIIFSLIFFSTGYIWFLWFLLLVPVYLIFITIVLFKSYGKIFALIQSFCIWLLNLVLILGILLMLGAAKVVEPTYYYYEYLKKDFSQKYRFPKEKIIYAVAFSMADDSIRSFVYDYSGENYLKYIPSGASKTLIDGGPPTSIICSPNNEQLKQNIKNLICTNNEKKIIYQKDTTDYSRYDIAQETTSYVIYPDKKLIWISSYHW